MTGRPYYVTLDDMYFQMVSTYRQMNPLDISMEPHEENRIKKILSKYKRYGWFDHKQWEPVFIDMIINLKIDKTDYWLGFQGLCLLWFFF